VIEDYDMSISQFEEILQKITANITSGIVSEKMPPSKIWKRSENDVTSLQSLAEKIKGYMLLLKPEKAPTIEKSTEGLSQPLSNFREILFRESDDPLANSKLALEELRSAVMEGSNLLELAKEINKNPSESISAVLRLKEVYDSKEYLSAIPVPEATHVRFVGLRRNIETLKLSISNLERALVELRRNLQLVVQETSKFRPLTAEKSEEKLAKPEVSSEERTGSEPTLVSEAEE
jgi:hypothetical protein